MRKSLIFFVSYLLLMNLTAVSQDISTDDLRKKLKQSWEKTDVPTIGFGYVTSEGERFTTSFGPAVWSRDDEDLTGDHIFRLASMTKAITSVAVLQLIERDLVVPDDFVGDYLPEIDLIPVLQSDGTLAAGSNRVTIRHLLTHTSGFGYEFLDQRLQEFQKPDEWPHSDMPRLAEAGIEWIYGTGTDWAGRLVEHISGMSLEDYFRENITGPLGMDRTWFNVPDSLKENIVSFGIRGTQSNGLKELPDRIPLHDAENYSGGGGLFSSVGDYLTFLQCLLMGGSIGDTQILKSGSVELMFRDQFPVVFRDVEDSTLSPNVFNAGVSAHSLAWAIQKKDNDYGRKVGSAYWSGMFNTYYSIDYNSGIAVVVMTNLYPFPDDQALGLYKKFEALVRLHTVMPGDR